MKHGDAQQTTD